MKETIEKMGLLIKERMKPHKSKNGRLVLFRKDNRLIFNILDSLGCFQFYIGNKNKEIIGVSQVMAFLHYGWKALLNGFTAENLEVHHIDGDVLNNEASNIIYLSKQDHLIVSHSTNTESYGRIDKENATPFNRNGKAISNPLHYLANVIKMTLEAVAKKRGGLRIKVSLPTILLDLPKSIHSVVIRSYFPSWFTPTILNSITTLQETTHAY